MSSGASREVAKVLLTQFDAHIGRTLLGVQTQQLRSPS
jgi:hypothetical protein